ncbi:MAG: hypothetical protein ACOYBT_09910 [Polynucleobacter sp.]
MQQLARDEAGHVWDVSDPARPVLVEAGSQAQAGQVFSLPPTAREQGQMESTSVSTARTRQQMAQDAATLPYADRKAAAETAAAEANARIAAAKAAEAGVNAHAIDPKLDRLTGQDYLSQLPAQTQAQVQALADGRMAFPSGAALRSPYWQEMLQHVAHFDPQFDAVNYNARAATRRDFVAGKSAQNIRALNTAIGHLGQLSQQTSGTASHSFTPWNALSNKVADTFGSAGPGVYNQTAGALASELTQVFRGAGGAEADIKRELDHLTPNASLEQKQAAVRNIAGLLKSRLDSLGDQYAQGMGTTAKSLKLLNPHAQQAYSVLSGLGAGDDNDMGGDGSVSAATGPTRNVPDPAGSALIDAAVRSGKSINQVNAGLAALGLPTANANQYKAAQDHFRRNPGFKGSYGDAYRQVPTTLHNRVSGSPAGVAIGATADAALGGFTDEAAGVVNSAFNGRSVADNISELNLGKQAAFAGSPKAALAGQVAGNALAMFTGGRFLQAGRVATALGRAAPYAGAGLWGAVSGAGQDNDNRSIGAVVGGLGGIAGQALGERVVAPLIGAAGRTAPVMAAANRARGLFGRPLRAPVLAPSAAQREIGAALAKADPAAVRGSLSEAAGLNTPFALADTHPELRELAAAAVRRSPTAAQVAENTLLPRGRGQIDRFGRAVESNLGPVANIPQLSEDMMQQARTAAGPLYDAAYARPGASSVRLDDLADRPLSMRPGMARARSIAAEEGRDPTSLGFGFDAEGNTTLNRVPSFQTLDYVKRGLDDVLEPHRDPLSGRLHLNEATRAINATKNELLGRIDAVNTDYAAARSAYAGPVSARDALARGRDAITLNPDELRYQVAQQTPEHLDQMQLGYQSGLMDRANSVRDTSNPFEATLATPAAHQRLAALYPNHPGVERLMRVREFERQMAETSNAVLGNSKTAQRGLADQAFAVPDILGSAVEAGVNLATGGGAGGLARSALSRSASVFGGKRMIRRGIAKADEIAPILLNPDPAAASTTMTELMQGLAQYRAMLEATTPRRSIGRLGSSIGQVAGTLSAR